MQNLSSKLKIKRLLVALLPFAFCLLPLKSAYADFSLGVYPPILQIQATVPTIITKDITVVNASDNPLDAEIFFRSFRPGPYGNGQVQYVSNTNSPGPDKDIFQKVQLLDGDNPIQDTVLAPKQKKTFTLRVGLPKDEPPADYYFSIIFQSHGSPNAQSASGSNVNAGIAVNVLLNIGPNSPVQGLLEEFSSPWFVQTGPVPFTVLLDNLSRQYIAPVGQIVVENMFGQLIGKVDLLSANVLGQSSRYIPSKEGSVADGPYTHPVAVWKEKVLFGPYSAHLVLSLSPEGPIIHKTIYFFAMPYQYLVGFTLAIIILLVVIERVRKRMKSI